MVINIMNKYYILSNKSAIKNLIIMNWFCIFNSNTLLYVVDYDEDGNFISSSVTCSKVLV